MSTNAVQAGNVIDYTAGANISAGDVVVIGNIIGVAINDIANGATGSVATRGVFTVPKVSGAVIAQGESLVWTCQPASSTTTRPLPPPATSAAPPPAPGRPLATASRPSTCTSPAFRAPRSDRR